MKSAAAAKVSEDWLAPSSPKLISKNRRSSFGSGCTFAEAATTLGPARAPAEASCIQARQPKSRHARVFGPQTIDMARSDTSEARAQKARPRPKVGERRCSRPKRRLEQPRTCAEATYCPKAWLAYLSGGQSADRRRRVADLSAKLVSRFRASFLSAGAPRRIAGAGRPNAGSCRSAHLSQARPESQRTSSRHFALPLQSSDCSTPCRPCIRRSCALRGNSNRDEGGPRESHARTLPSLHGPPPPAAPPKCDGDELGFTTQNFTAGSLAPPHRQCQLGQIRVFFPETHRTRRQIDEHRLHVADIAPHSQTGAMSSPSWPPSPNRPSSGQALTGELKCDCGLSFRFSTGVLAGGLGGRRCRAVTRRDQLGSLRPASAKRCGRCARTP